MRKSGSAPAPERAAERSIASDEGGAASGGRSSSFRLTRLWPIALIVGLLAALYVSGLHTYLSLDTIIAERKALAALVDANIGLAALGYTLAYIGAVAVSFPGASLLTVLGGFLFGVVLGTVFTTVGATLGASIIFLAAKTSLGEPLRERAGRFAQRFAEGFEENAFNYLLSLRLVPLFPFWLINVAPALFNVSLLTYMAATALGIVPGVIAYSLLGDGLNALIEAQEEANPGCAQAGTCEIDLSALVTWEIVAAMVALSLAALIPVAVKRIRRSRTAA